MHIKTNIELNIMHFAILAICPLLLVTVNVKQTLFMIVLTLICFVVSALFCLLLSRVLTRNIKIFISALISTFIVTLVNLYLSKYNLLDLKAETSNFFAALSAVILCVDIYYLDTNSAPKNYFISVLSLALSFACVQFVYSPIKEFAAFGTIFGKYIFDFKGLEFCNTMMFSLILLAFLAVFAQMIYKAIINAIDDRKMAYQKYVKLVREEKEFQYDTLRRNKLLTSEIETKHIDNTEADEMLDKTSVNELAISDSKSENPEAKENSKTKKRKTKKNKKLKFSKETKVEKVFDRNSKQEDK